MGKKNTHFIVNLEQYTVKDVMHHPVHTLRYVAEQIQKLKLLSHVGESPGLRSRVIFWRPAPNFFSKRLRLLVFYQNKSNKCTISLCFLSPPPKKKSLGGGRGAAPLTAPPLNTLLMRLLPAPQT